MKKGILLSLAFLFLLAVPFQPANSKVSTVLAPQAPGGKTISDPIPIDTRLGLQYDPAVAYSSLHRQYLVVYRTGDDDIWGRFISADSGDPVGGNFPIYESNEYYAWNPDVAYDSTCDRFVVVWETSDLLLISQEIQSIVVYGQHQSTGAQIPAGASATDLSLNGASFSNPSIAANTDEGQLMVVYELNTSIISRMLRVASNGYEIDPYETDFTVRPTTLGIGDLDVAWGDGGVFLVVWDEFMGSGLNKIICRYLHDTYQSDGEQAVDSYTYDISNYLSMTVHKSPAVAYDSIFFRFAVVYSSLTDSISDLYQITGVFVDGYNYEEDPVLDNGHATIQPLVGFPNEDNYGPAVAYLGVKDMMQVVYSNTFTNIFDKEFEYVYGREFGYNGFSAFPLARFMVSPPPGLNEETPLPDAGIASSGDGRSLVVWTKKLIDSDWDVYGRLIGPYAVYLPAVYRNNP